MSLRGRYDTSSPIEAQYEPGSHRRVLKNLLGIRRKREIDAVEAVALAAAMERVVHLYDQEHRFTAEDESTDLRIISRRFTGSRRYGLVWLRGFDMAAFYYATRRRG